MSLLKYIGRLKRMDDLIRRRATGSPEEFAKKLGIRKSMLMYDLKELRELGAVVRYDTVKQTYCYESDCRLVFKFEMSLHEEQALKGGKNIYSRLVHSNPIGMEFLYLASQGFES